MIKTNNSNQTQRGYESQLAAGKPAAHLQMWSKIWTRDYREQIKLAVRVGLELGASELQVQRSTRSAMLPPYKWRRVVLPKPLF